MTQLKSAILYRCQIDLLQESQGQEPYIFPNKAI